MTPVDFWIALAAMAVITWLTRAMPFLMKRRWLDLFSRPDTPLAVLGPALLAAICAAVVVPELIRLTTGADAALLPYVLGVAGTVVIAATIRNTGGAVLGSVALYGVILYLSQRLGA